SPICPELELGLVQTKDKRKRCVACPTMGRKFPRSSRNRNFFFLLGLFVWSWLSKRDSSSECRFTASSIVSVQPLSLLTRSQGRALERPFNEYLRNCTLAQAFGLSFTF
ncbi:mCG1044766, partial [Mus musculus]